MLNLFEKKKATFTLFPKQLHSDFIYTNISDQKDDSLLKEKYGQPRHYPSATKEWVNSVYSYNKNFTKTLPVADNMVNRLIKSYFSLTPLFEGKKSKRVQIRFRRLSLNRILVSKAEMKHTNNKVIITVYIYNKNRKFFIYKLKNLYKRLIFKIPSLDINKKKITKKPINKQKKFGVQKYKQKGFLARRGFETLGPSKTYSISGKRYTITKLLKTKTFSTKRFKRSNTLFNSYKTKRFNYMNFTNLTKRRLSRFIFKIKNINIKNKYKSLIREYYSMLNKYKFYNLNNNKNYYLNYVNLAKDGYNNKVYYTSNFYAVLKKNNVNTLAFKTKRNNVTFDSFIGEQEFSSAHTLCVIKNKRTRSLKNMMYKLKSVYRVLNINNLLNGMHNSESENNLGSGLGELSPKNNFFANMYRLLKNPLKISPSKKSKRLSSGSKLAINNSSKKKINYISLKALKLINKARKHKNFLIRTLKWNNDSFINYENKYYNAFVEKVYKKEVLYLYYVKMLSINHNKFKNWFLIGLKKVISKIYRKKIEFNLVNLKYLHLNSDIFSESIATKLRNRQNRLLTVLKKALRLVRLPSINNTSSNLVSNRKTNKNFINKYNTLNHSQAGYRLFSDGLNELLNNIFIAYSQKSSNKSNSYSTSLTQQKNVLDSIKHKAVFGVRLEAAGRLSKRLTASRSVFKLKYKGSLKNVDSSYHGLSSVILRGNIKPNIQYTKISSKTRNGSFGLKGWVSGY